MFEQLIYKNHINEEIQFGANGIFVNENELHDYEWKYNSDNEKLTNFNRGIRSLKVPVVIAIPNSDDGVSAINKLMEIAEKDVLANEAGRFIVGDYYYKAYITASKKKNYNVMRGFTQAELTIVSDAPAWVREITNRFSKNSGEQGKNLDFSFDFPYDFTSPNLITTVTNPSFADVDFKIVMYGGSNGVSNPSVTIGGNVYKVNCNIGAGEYLVINSKEKTVYINKIDGTQENHFKDRLKTNYIFKKITSGTLNITWNGSFDFDVILYEERSEPKWT